MKPNISCKKNYILESSDMLLILEELNKSRFLNRQNYTKKNTVSFFDDDDICYFILCIPDSAGFDEDMLSLVDLFADWFGITGCKVNGEWL